MKTRLRPATEADLAFAVAELSDVDLPTSDLTADALLLAAESGSELVGVIGFEPFGDVALLRSLVVAKSARSHGVGRDLVNALESHALTTGVTELWLLTIDADRWFAKLGYVVRDRAAAPTAIRETAEFSGLCPGDAVLMSKSL